MKFFYGPEKTMQNYDESNRSFNDSSGKFVNWLF